MLDVLISLVKEFSAFGAILTFAVAVASAALWLQQGALKEEGHDRNRLLRSLKLGGDIRRHYVFWVRRALNRIDRFLGDADQSALSLPSPFGNIQAAPFWTGQSFDTCAVLAYCYPITSIFLTWIWSGLPGEIGERFGMLPDAPLWLRAGALILIAWVGSWWWIFTNQGGTSVKPILALVLGIGVASAIAAPIVGFHNVLGVALSGFLGSWLLTSENLRFDGRPVGASLIIMQAILVLSRCAFELFGQAAALIGGACLLILFLLVFPNVAPRHLGRAWLLLWPVAIIVMLLEIGLSALSGFSASVQIALVVLGLVPLVNLPFDWASVGFTRALLRRGCERGAPSPLWLGLLDLAIGLLLLVCLAAALVATLHLVDWITVRVADRSLVDLPGRLFSLVTTPTAEANWWIYATLLSTLLPSALNCIVGAFSLMSATFPSQRRWLIETIPRLKAVGYEGTRRKVLAVLGMQAFIGAFGSGLVIWGFAVALLYGGQYILFLFAYEAVFLERLLPT